MNRVLSRRAINRATLARQFLLERTDRQVLDVVEHLLGLQAQTPHTWYIGLWSRIDEFQPEQVAGMLTDRTLVRIALMRSTIHLVASTQAQALRSLVQPVLDRDLYTNATHGRPIQGADVSGVIAAGRSALEARVMTAKELGGQLNGRWSDIPPATLAYAVRNLVPLVQVPPRGLWGRSGPIAHTTLDHWVGAVPQSELTLQHLVLRYLASFGPATVADVQRWSGLTRLREVIDPLRPQLLIHRGEDGQELFDVPEAPRPDPETPAPPRFLYDFDNLLLSYADRSRVLTEDVRLHSFRPHGPVPSLILIDGFAAGDWTIHRTADAALVRIRPYSPLSDADRTELIIEGRRLLALTDPGAADHRIEISNELSG